MAKPNWLPIRTSFLEYIKRLDRITIAEIGVDKGENALAMLRIYPNIDLTLVDIKKQVDIKGARFIEKSSEEASKEFPDDYFDYVYLDAAHDYESVKKDLVHWYPKVKIGGMLAGHDFVEESVRKAVLEYFGEGTFDTKGLNYLSLCRSYSDDDMLDWWIVKENR